MAMAGFLLRTPSLLLSKPSGMLRLLPACTVVNSSVNCRHISSSAAANARLSGRNAKVLGEEGSVRKSFGHRFSIRAVNVTGPGSVDSPLMSSMQAKIKEQLDAEKVTVKDAYGDGRHVSIDVVAAVFEGKSAVNRQRMVYKAIWEELQETVHAVDQLRTFTPAEAANRPEDL
ncbi:hypothetical protein R1flu_013288 [Riccia fluitans]|uniref:Protein BOLA4, chloroplastic/mitochondrial n=1 Tax=Riccia fluitans TaxID=41844 RepID=A0ABD1YG05_9MARC